MILRLKEVVNSTIDNTRKYIFYTVDKLVIEFSYINKNDGKDIICIPSQSFYNLGCKFCHTSDFIGVIKNRNLSVAVDPNQFKLIKVPVVVMGEAAGTVYMGSGNSLKGQGRITVNFYRKDMSKLSSTLSESDGYFTYMGLAPGEYFVGLDSLQMQKLNMTILLIEHVVDHSRLGFGIERIHLKPLLTDI